LDERNETNKDIMKENTVKESDESTYNDSLKIQYEQLSEDWRHFNNILWGIPAVAVSIMAGIILVSYQSALAGVPRFVSLTIGALFLFALTIEVIKKRVHLNAISDILDKLQGPTALKLKPNFNFPVGLANDVEEYWPKKGESLKKEDFNWFIYWLRRRKGEPFKKEDVEPTKDWLFYWLRRSSARRFLAYVTFSAAIAVSILAVITLTGVIIHCYNYPMPC